MLLQDARLKNVISSCGQTDWQLLASFFPDRSEMQCQHRWFKVLNPDLVKGPWTKEVCLNERKKFLNKLLFIWHNSLRMQFELYAKTSIVSLFYIHGELTV